MVSKSDDLISKYINFISKNFVLLLVAKFIVIGFAIRIAIQNSSFFSIGESESLTLLIGKDFSDGQISAFRYGHNFAGTIEYIFITPLVFIFGTSNVVAKIVPLLFLILTSILVWYAFKRTPYRDETRITMSILWIWPTYFVFSTSNITGYVSVLLFLHVAILASAYFAAHSLINKKHFLVFSFLAGLAVWIYPLSIVFSIICYLWIVKCAPTLKSMRLRSLAIFILGSLFWWAKTIAENGTNLNRFFSDSIGPVTNDFGNNFESLLTYLGLKTQSNTMITNELNKLFLVLFLLSIIIVLVFCILGAFKAFKTKKVDFAYLTFWLLISQLSIALIYSVFSIKLGPYFYTGLAFPLVFVTIYFANSKMFRSVLACALLFASTISIFAFTTSAPNLGSTKIENLSQSLEKNNISKAIASHKVSYPITLKSENKITVTPFDYNAFDSKREDKVKNDVQAIVVDSKQKSQSDLAFCIQGAFSRAFEKIEVDQYDIYLVPDNLRSKVFYIKTLCNKSRPL